MIAVLFVTGLTGLVVLSVQVLEFAGMEIPAVSPAITVVLYVAAFPVGVGLLWLVAFAWVGVDVPRPRISGRRRHGRHEPGAAKTSAGSAAPSAGVRAVPGDQGGVTIVPAWGGQGRIFIAPAAPPAPTARAARPAAGQGRVQPPRKAPAAKQSSESRQPPAARKRRPHERRRKDRPEPRAAYTEEADGVRIHHGEMPPPPPSLVLDSPVLQHACLATGRGLPGGDEPAATDGAQQAALEAREMEPIVSLSEWRSGGQDTADCADRAVAAAREQAWAEARGAGRTEEQGRRLVNRRGREAARAALPADAQAPWRTPVGELRLSDGDVETLRKIARMYLTAPRVLAQLLNEPLAKSAMHERLKRLHGAGLLACSEVVRRRRGTRPLLYAIAPRGLEYLRAQDSPDREPPRHFSEDRLLPVHGKGQEVPHELAIQVALAAYAERLSWRTSRMPGGRWDVGMIHGDGGRELRGSDLLPSLDYRPRGERLGASPTVVPDLAVGLEGTVDGEAVTLDMLVEVDRTGRGAYNAKKFAAYDQFLGGWCTRTADFRDGRPLVVFVADEARAIPGLMAAADPVMTLGYAAPGVYDEKEFDYPGRGHTAFTCMPWLLAGYGHAMRLPDLPPRLRDHEDRMEPEIVALLPEAWWPAQAC